MVLTLYGPMYGPLEKKCLPEPAGTTIMIDGVQTSASFKHLFLFLDVLKISSNQVLHWLFWSITTKC